MAKVIKAMATKVVYGAVAANVVTGATVQFATKAAATWQPQANSARANHLSWQGVQAAIKAGNGTATVAALKAAIQKSNPTNQGNWQSYLKYMVRGGKLIVSQAA